MNREFLGLGKPLCRFKSSNFFGSKDQGTKNNNPISKFFMETNFTQ